MYGLNNSKVQPQPLEDSTSLDYKLLCSENDNKSIINFVNWTQSLELKNFVTLLYIERIRPNEFKKMFQMGIKKFNHFVIIMKLNSDVPVRPIWTKEPIAQLQVPNGINEIFRMYLKWINDIKTNVNSLILNFKNIFEKIDFSTYNLLLSSFNNLSIHSIYTQQ